MLLEIYRGEEIVNTIEVGEEAIYKEALMADHQIEVPGVVTFEPLDLQLDDYILYQGVKFKINTVPDVVVEYDYTYTIIFEGPKFTWHDKLFMDEGSNEFTYYGNAYDLMLLFLLNVNEIDPGWSLGTIEATTEQHIPFTGGDAGLFCYEAIKQVAEAFKLEYSINGKEISLVKKVGRDTGLSFEYGMGKGLFDLKRSYVNEKNVITKAYGFGGTKNLPIGYGKPRLTYDPGFAIHNTELYKIKEGKYVNDDLYPHREALATAVTFGDNVYTLTDTTLDFDINACLLKDLTAKISFITGELSGETFEITGYNSSTKIITYKGFTNGNNVTLPNTTFKAKVGDKYTLVDLNMPDSYITTAKAQIQSETEAFVLENSVPQLEYSGTADPLHLRENSIDLRPGDRVYFKDTKMGFNDSIRITEISYPITFPDLLTNDTRVNITVGNFVSYTTQQRLKADVLQVKNEIQVVDIRRAEAARRNNANLFNLRDLVIDPTTEKYYTGKIATGSIETLYLAVGAKATNYSLKNVAFNTNAGGNPNAFTVTLGQLVHYDLKIEGAGFVWEMQPFNTTALVSANTYYLYAKVSRNSLVGSWIVSTSIIAVESVAGFWHLQAGVLFPVKDGRRDYELTKGMSFIIGDQITAGVLKSLDGLNYFNLTDGKFNLGDSNSGIDWNVSTPNRLTIRGGITQNAGGISAPIPVFRGPYGNTTTYYKGDTVTYNGSTWAYIYQTPIFNVTPVEGAYWTVQAQKGTDGKTSYLHIKYSNDNGQTFTQNNGESVGKYIGQYTDFVFTDSDDVYDYQWALIRGADGVDGIDGLNGGYKEMRFQLNGSTNIPPYLEPSDPNPLLWTVEQPNAVTGQYLWVITGQRNGYGQFLGVWSNPIRFNGLDGANGVAGSQGPYLIPRGNYDPIKTYVGTVTRLEVVQYSGTWYVTRSDAGSITGVLPTDNSKWNTFGAQFESVATDILFATLAYIENLGVRNLSTAEPGAKCVVIDGLENNIRILNAARQVLVELDDDSAAEGVYWNTFPPLVHPVTGAYPKDYLYMDNVGGVNRYYYSTMGPGISVGISATDSNGFSSVGRKEIRTNGKIVASDASGSNKTEITKTGITTTGDLELGGNLKVNGDFVVGSDIGVTTDINAGGAHMRFVKGLYVGYW